MPTLIVGAIAVFAGLLLGYWMGKSSAQATAQAEKNAALAASALLQEQLKSLLSEKESLAADARRLQEAAACLNAELSAEKATAEAMRKQSVQANAEIERLRAELAAKTGEESKARAQVSGLETALGAERKKLSEQLALLDEAKKTLSDHFRALASGILDEKSKSFSEGSQKEIGTLLDPLKIQIKEFREKVEQTQSDSKTGVAKLEGLIGNLSNLNQKIATEAQNLATALRGSAKAQGDWGEFILRDLLEKAGLREGEQYSFQQVFQNVSTVDDTTKNARTDVIVKMPGGRNLVIDSKVSLTAYTDSVNAATDEERAAALKLHLVSVRKHIDELARASYHLLPGIESPDFVVLFMPIEPAFLLALQADANLWADAYSRNVLLVGPTTLLYVIRIINVLWQQEAQSRNVRDVMERGAALYDKFANFVEDLKKVGINLRAADTSYSNAMKKLSEGRGNLVRQAEMLKELGVRTTKSLPPDLLDSAENDAPALTTESELARRQDSESAS